LRCRAFGSLQKKRVLFRGNRDPGRHVLAGEILSPESTEKALTIVREFVMSVRKRADHAPFSDKELPS